MDQSHSFRFECIRCGECCTNSNTIVNVTYFDIKRLKEGLKLTIDELIQILGFYVFENEPTEEDKKKMVISPIQTERGSAFVGLFKKTDGSCYFYSKEGKKCLIYEIRPMFCRTFPFSFRYLLKDDHQGEAEIEILYTEKGKQFCPGIGENSPLIDVNKCKKIGEQALEELNRNYFIMQRWNEGVEESKIEPSVKRFLLMLFED